MILACDLIQDGIHLQRVVALDILETVGPRGEIGIWVAYGGAAGAGRSSDTGKRNNIGVDLRGIKIVEFPARTGYRGIGGVLVGPGGVSAGGMDDAEHGVSAHEILGKNRGAALLRIAVQFGCVDRGNASIGEARSRSSAVQQGLIEIDAFFVLGGIASRRFCGIARRCRVSVAGGGCGSVERAVIGNIVVDAHGARSGSADDVHQPGERVGGLGCAGREIIHAPVRKSSKVGAIRLAVVHSGSASGAVQEINRVHAIDTDQQDVLNLVLAGADARLRWRQRGHR